METLVEANDFDEDESEARAEALRDALEELDADAPELVGELQPTKANASVSANTRAAMPVSNFFMSRLYPSDW